MSLLDELYEDGENSRQEELKQINRDEIQRVQQFLREYKARRWQFVNVEFGDQLIKDNKGRFREFSETYSIDEMKRVKGLNYGSHEFSYQHNAIILNDVNIKHIDKTTTLIVAPVSTTKRRNSIFLEKRYHQFLAYDSYLLLEEMSNIGLEKINIRQSKQSLVKQNKILYEASVPVQREIKTILQKMFAI